MAATVKFSFFFHFTGQLPVAPAAVAYKELDLRRINAVVPDERSYGFKITKLAINILYLPVRHRGSYPALVNKMKGVHLNRSAIKYRVGKSVKVGYKFIQGLGNLFVQYEAKTSLWSWCSHKAQPCG